MSNLDQRGDNLRTVSRDASTARRIGFDSEEYPCRLRPLPDIPESLYVLGNLADCEVSVAIVGARAASGDGIATAHSLAMELARSGVLVVSGGALGIDAAAHRGALTGGGSTIAVLGSGLDVLYPERNQPLFEAICFGGGALVSPFPPTAPPLRGHFIKRNRIIAGLADAVLVVEASSTSGALHTAGAARDYGRVVGAVPGTPGCESLISLGAAVVESAADVFDALADRPRRPRVVLPEKASAQARVLDVLDDAPRDGEEIADRTGLQIREVTRALAGLELEGLALLVPGRNYVRSTLAQELMAR